MSGVASEAFRINSACASILIERRSPPCYCGAGVPYWVASCCHQTVPRPADVTGHPRSPPQLYPEDLPTMLEPSCQPPAPAGILNQKTAATGIPLLFSPARNRSRGLPKILSEILASTSLQTGAARRDNERRGKVRTRLNMPFSKRRRPLPRKKALQERQELQPRRIQYLRF